MVVWFNSNHGNEFSDIETVFQTIQDWVLKVSIWAGFCSKMVGKCMLNFVMNYFSGQFSG